VEKQRRSYPWIIAVVAIFLFFFLGKQAQKRRFAVTGVGLPANLRVASHASDRNDNLFRTTHYWIVQGPIESLRELAPALASSARMKTHAASSAMLLVSCRSAMPRCSRDTKAAWMAGGITG
jgi:hypothetical protein